MPCQSQNSIDNLDASNELIRAPYDPSFRHHLQHPCLWLRKDPQFERVQMVASQAKKIKKNEKKDKDKDHFVPRMPLEGTN